MLVAFTFDGTLARSDAYTLLGEEAGVADEIAAIAERARTGDLALAESVRQRADRLSGLPELEVEAALERVALRPGAADLVGDLRDAGHHVAVVTAAPTRAVDLAFDRPEGGPDTVVAPRLGVERNALTGEVTGRLLEASTGEVLGELAVETGVGPDDTVAVGSDANDRAMLEAATDAVCLDPVGGVERHCETTVTSVERLRDRFAARDLL